MQSLTLSYSKLAEYDQCPLKYKYHYVLKYPTMSSPALFLGQVVHDTIHSLYSLTGDKAFKHDIFRKKWAEHKARAKDKEGFSMNRDEEMEYGRKGLAMISTFINSEYTEQPEYAEEMFKTSLVFGKIDFLGKIDRLGTIGNTTEPVITDYKTGKFSPKFLDTFQIYAYVWLARDLGIDVRKGQMFFLAENQIVTKKLAEVEFEAVKDVLLEKSMAIYEALQKDDFPPSKGVLCNWCDFKPLCPVHSQEKDQQEYSRSENGQMAFL